MGDHVGGRLVGLAGGVVAPDVAVLHDGLGLVDGQPDRHAVAERRRRRGRRSRRTGTRCRATPSRRGPAGPAAGPSGRAWPSARCRARAGRRRAAGRSPGPSGWARRCRRPGSAARRWRTGTCAGRGRASGRGRPRSGGSGRRRCRRCRRCGPCPGVRLKVSHTDSPRPSSLVAPSIWYAEVAAPQPKPSGKRRPSRCSGAGTRARVVGLAAGGQRGGGARRRHAGGTRGRARAALRQAWRRCAAAGRAVSTAAARAIARSRTWRRDAPGAAGSERAWSGLLGVWPSAWAGCAWHGSAPKRSLDHSRMDMG